MLFSKLWLLPELVKFLANNLKQGVEDILMVFDLLNANVMYFVDCSIDNMVLTKITDETWLISYSQAGGGSR